MAPGVGPHAPSRVNAAAWQNSEAAGPRGIPGQPVRTPDQTTVRRTSTLPRVALEYGHT
ncbi:hypothetical protein ABIA43_002840 [Bradyrhizobium sp. USDA 328]